MKKLLSITLILFILSEPARAGDTIIKTTARTIYSRWERNSLNLRIGPEVGFAVGDFGKTDRLGIGGSALLDIPVAQRWSIIFYAGARSYGGGKVAGSEEKFKRSNVFPLRTGINYKLRPDFYVSGQIGESTVQYLGVYKTSISQALGIGYFNGLLDLGARWDHEYAHTGLSSIVFQVRYVISLALKRD